MLNEEALGYYVETHPDLPLVRRLLAWFRQMLRKLGETFTGLRRAQWFRWASSLSTDDLVYRAQAALKGSVATGEPGGAPGVDTAYRERGDLRSSRAPQEDPEAVFAGIDRAIPAEGAWERPMAVRTVWSSLATASGLRLCCAKREREVDDHFGVRPSFSRAGTCCRSPSPGATDSLREVRKAPC